MLGRTYFYGVSHAPRPKWRGPGIPQVFEISYMRTHSMRNNNQILHRDQTRCEEIFTWSTTPFALANFFGDTDTDAAICLR